MSIKKDLYKITNKLQELEKSKVMFEKEEFIERGNCKRNIRRKDLMAASKNATKCIGLSRKSHVYINTCQRLRNVLEYVHENMDENIAFVVKNIERSLSQGRLDLLELHLETFEELISKEEVQEPDVATVSEMNKSKRDILDTPSVGAMKAENTLEKGKSSSKKPFYSKRTDPNKENCLIMYKIVAQEEVKQFLSKISIEVAEEDKSFMFRKITEPINKFDL